MKELLAEPKQVIRDIAQGFADVWQGAPLDPKRFAVSPPKWWKKKNEKPVYEPPKKRKPNPNAREFWGSEMLAECLEMSDYEWLTKYGTYSVIRWSDKYGSHQNQRFADRDEMIDWLEAEMLADTDAQQKNEINFDSEINEVLTPRDFGELRAYKNHNLNDYELAAKVKILKMQGHKPKAISVKLNEDYQLIRHYSSALGKAEK